MYTFYVTDHFPIWFQWLSGLISFVAPQLRMRACQTYMYTIYVTDHSLIWFQWLSGLISFVAPQLSMRARQTYMPHHVFWGLAILCLAAASAVTGMTEKALFTDFYSSL